MTTMQQRHEQFIRQAVESQQVWGLSSPEGWVTAESEEFENTPVLPFWSNQTDAQQCTVEEWKQYQPTVIALPEFIENWCAGMHNNGELVGTNWTPELMGKESEPLELMAELLLEIRRTSTDITFANHSSTEALLDLINKLGNN